MNNYNLIFLLSVSCVPVQKVSPISETELFNKTVSTIVVVYSFDKNNELIGQGTGVVLTNTGTIATNYHVINGSYF